MSEYTYSVSGNSCTIRNARTGVNIRQLSRGGERIKDVVLSGDTVSLILESGTYVYDIKTGVTLRSFK